MKQYENFLLSNTYNKLLNNMKINWKIFIKCYNNIR